MAEIKEAAVLKGKEMELERLRVEIEYRKAETERFRESKEASEAKTISATAGRKDEYKRGETTPLPCCNNVRAIGGWSAGFAR